MNPAIAEVDKGREESHKIAMEVINGIEWTLKIARGEVPRPKKNTWLEDLQREIDEGDFSHEED